VQARYSDGRGHPVLLARDVWGEVARARGDVGARALMRARPDLVGHALVDAARPHDMDTPEDYERLVARSGDE
jgi:molybdenum cofactor cytidylyltransferase